MDRELPDATFKLTRPIDSGRPRNLKQSREGGRDLTPAARPMSVTFDVIAAANGSSIDDQRGPSREVRRLTASPAADFGPPRWRTTRDVSSSTFTVRPDRTRISQTRFPASLHVPPPRYVCAPERAQARGRSRTLVVLPEWVGALVEPSSRS